MRITHPTTRSVGLGGLTFEADENGIIDVPDDAIALLHPAHGFSVVLMGSGENPTKPKRRKRKAVDDSIHDLS